MKMTENWLINRSHRWM